MTIVTVKAYTFFNTYNAKVRVKYSIRPLILDLAN